jgi:hypothetical protein
MAIALVEHDLRANAAPRLLAKGNRCIPCWSQCMLLWIMRQRVRRYQASVALLPIDAPDRQRYDSTRSFDIIARKIHII